MKKARILDNIDHSIINILRENPRIRKKSISKIIGLSETTVGMRIDRLSKSNMMRVVAQKEMLHFGLKFIYIINIFSEGRSIDDIATDISDIDAALTVSIMLGMPEIIVTMFGTSPEAIHDNIINRILKVPGVQRFEAQVVSEVLKMRSEYGELSTEIPQFNESDSETDIDSKILSHLSMNGLCSNRELANKFHVSETLVRTRINRMLENNSIKFSVICDNSMIKMDFAVQIYLRVDYNKIRSACQCLEKMESVVFLSTLSGPHNVTLTVYSQSATDLAALCNEQIRSIAGVEDIFVRPIVRHVKHRYDLIRSPEYQTERA